MKTLFLLSMIGWVCCCWIGRASSFSPPQQPSLPHRLSIRNAPSTPSSTSLYGVRSTVRKIFRRRTLVKEDTSTKDDDTEPPKMYRLMYFDDCDYGPENVARVIAKSVPSLNRRTAYHLVSYARENGKVPLLVNIDEGTAERSCALLRRNGLHATVELHGEKQ